VKTTVYLVFNVIKTGWPLIRRPPVYSSSEADIVAAIKLMGRKRVVFKEY
jgi:hypothetical protein